MLLGKDKSRAACISAENLAQTAPIDSFSRYSKSRIALGREPIQDIGKNARQNLSLSSSQSPFILPTTRVYHCFTFPIREKGNNVHLSAFCVMPECSGTNTFPWTLAGDCMGFHYHARRRVVPEPWLLSQGGIHCQMKVLVLVVA